jgi:hypothetical protein
MEMTPQILIAGIALANGLVSGAVALFATWLVHRFTAAREARKADADGRRERGAILREKLERFVTLVEEHCSEEHRRGIGVATFLIKRAYGIEGDDPVESAGVGPLEAANAIQVLYFPELADAVASLRAATGTHVAFLTEELQHATQHGAKVWARERHPTFIARRGEAFQAMLLAQRSVEVIARGAIKGILEGKHDDLRPSAAVKRWGDCRRDRV